MAGERVPVVGAYGEKGTVDAKDLAAVEAAGGRAATSEEQASDKLEAEYASKSLAQKALGAVSPALPYPAQQALRASGAAVLPPTIEAYRRGAGAGFTANLEGITTHEALKAVGGKAAADAYSKQNEELKAAHSTAYSLGEAAGMVGSTIATGGAGGLRGTTAKGLGRILPGAAIAEAGALAERGAARVVGGLATRGALGRAAATGTQFAARAGVEGALYSAASEISEEVLGDKPLAAEKILMAAGTGFGIGAAAGGVMGFGGSLLASGARSAATGLSRMVSTAAAEEGGIASRLAKPGAVESTLRTQAQEQATKSLTIGGKIGNRMGKLVERAGGEAAMGETLIRNGVVGTVDESQGLVRNMFDAAKGGTPADMVPKIKTALEEVGSKIGDLTSTSSGRVSVEAIDSALAKHVSEYAAKPGFENTVSAIQKYRDSLAMAMADKADDALTVTVQDALKFRRDLDELVYRETRTLDPNARVQALRDFRSEFASEIETAIDKASDAAEGETRAQLKALNKDYQRLKVAEEIAEDSAARASQNRTISLTDTIAGAATGDLFAGGAAAIGHKMLRERGNAAASVLLQRMADMGAITKAVASVDELVGRAAKGAVNPQPIVRPAVSKATAMARAEKVAAVIREHQADPYRSAARIEERVSDVRRVAPQTADHVSAAMSRALAFLSSQVPPSSRRGQFETNKGRMSEEDARKLLRASEYASQPATILRDIGAGKIDRTTVEAAKALTPEVFAELQLRTMDQIQEAQAKGRPIPYKQRIKLSTLLDIPGDWTVAPKALAMLQMNASAGPDGEDNERPAKPSGRVELGTQQSTLDRIESR